MYEIHICPVKRLYDIAAEADLSDCAALLVSSYDIHLEKLHPLCRIAVFHFADVSDPQAADALRADTAQTIAAFVERLPPGLDTLFVCCDSGESRSAAMAAALLRRRGENERRIWQNPHYHPNPLVYRRLCAAFGLAVSEAELNALAALNRDALRRTIEASRR